MKRIIILSLISLLIPITTISQNISEDSVKISIQQLKQTNLIFLEHGYLKEKVPLLEQRIDNLNELNRHLVEQDSLKTIQFNKEKTKLKNRTKMVGGLGILAAILIFIFK